MVKHCSHLLFISACKVNKHELSIYKNITRIIFGDYQNYFILILQSNKDDKFNVDKDWEPEVDFDEVVSERLATTTKNRHWKYASDLVY